MNNKIVQEAMAIALGGGLGSVLRFALSRWVQAFSKTENFPWGILIVNLLGCLVIGIFFGIFVEKFNIGPVVRAGIFLGLLGGFTTFSSFSLDVVTLMYTGAYGAAAIYIFSSVGLGILATILGLSLVRGLFHYI